MAEQRHSRDGTREVNTGRLGRLLEVQPGEWRRLVWSFVYFFALLCSYYIVRPMRDEMGIAGGVDQLQWMFSGTFAVMLAVVPVFGWVARRFPVRRFLPWTYVFFIGNLLLFYILFKSTGSPEWVARAFFIWASVYNLYMVSLFWSFMADTHDADQAKRLFGVIAAGGTVGALAGPALTAGLVMVVEPAELLLLSAGFLALAVFSIRRILAGGQSQGGYGKGTKRPAAISDERLGGSLFAGIRLVLRSPYLAGICVLMLLYTTLSTFLYFEQAQLVGAAFEDSAERTAVFAAIDLAVNALTLLAQFLLTSRIISRVGLHRALAMVPVALGVGFLLLGWAPVLATVLAVQVARRAGNYALMRPAREMLYVVVSRREKYQAKNVIDTVVYRGGDAVSAWAFSGMEALGLGLSGIAFAAVPLAGIWAGVSYLLGRRQMQKAMRPDAGMQELGE